MVSPGHGASGIMRCAIWAGKWSRAANVWLHDGASSCTSSRAQLLWRGAKAVKRALRPGELERIVCPIDVPEDVHERLGMITRFAKALRAEVQLVHAVDVDHDLSRPRSVTESQFEFEMLAAHLLREGVAAEALLLYGAPEEVIAEWAAQSKANYILFVMDKDGNFSSFFRKSLVSKLIKFAPCAILAFPQSGDDGADSGDH
jgi:hypothetical protein